MLTASPPCAHEADWSHTDVRGETKFFAGLLTLSGVALVARGWNIGRTGVYASRKTGAPLTGAESILLGSVLVVIGGYYTWRWLRKRMHPGASRDETPEP
jgi:hypothetical protein